MHEHDDDDLCDLETMATLPPGRLVSTPKPASGQVILLLYHQAGVEVVPLEPGRQIVVGRASPADVVVKNPRLSREHARFWIMDGDVWVEDLKSKNGTQVNNRAVTRQMLAIGDRASMPGVTAMLHSEDPSPVAAPLQREVEDARRIQQRLLGPSEVADCGPLQVAGYYRPASVCGGDFWNLFNMGEDQTLVVIGDVVGHGMAAAMLTAAVKACCETFCSTQETGTSIRVLMQTLNRVIHKVGGQQTMTLFAMRFDLASRKATYANAGHPMPYLCRLEADGHQLRSLAASGNLLGDLPKWDFPVHDLTLQDGDLLLWYSDGLTDRETRDGTRFGEKRLRQMLLEHVEQPVDVVRDAIIAEVARHCRGGTPEDDVTLVVGRLAF